MRERGSSIYLGYFLTNKWTPPDETQNLDLSPDYSVMLKTLRPKLKLTLRLPKY